MSQVLRDQLHQFKHDAKQKATQVISYVLAFSSFEFLNIFPSFHQASIDADARALTITALEQRLTDAESQASQRENRLNEQVLFNTFPTFHSALWFSSLLSTDHVYARASGGIAASELVVIVADGEFDLASFALSRADQCAVGG